MALNDAQWSDAVALAVSRFHTGVTTAEQMADEITAATQDWPTRTLSNAGLALKISRSLASLTGIIETVGPPDPEAGTLGAMAFDNQALAFYGPKTELGWGDARPIDAGPPGPAIEMQVSGGFIQWRVVGDAAWTNLISVADLTGAPGADGREVEIQASATHIQWRYSGDTSWIDLIALSALKGADGREVEMQASATHIQWRYAGDATWTDIVALSDLTGATGNAAWTPVFAVVADGERRVQQIVDWIGGQGAKPAAGKYVGPTGLVDTAAEATDIRGSGGSGSGDMIAANNLSDLTDKAAARANLSVYSISQIDSSLAGKQSTSEKGQINGYAGLGADGKVPPSQLPDPPASPAFATVAEVRAGSADGKVISPKAVADAQANVVITRADAAVGINFDGLINATITLDANGTLGPPSGGYPGKSGVFTVINGTGTASLAFNAAYRMPKGGITLESGVNAATRIPYMIGGAGAVILFPASKWSA